jgi:hypothetical protein
MRFNSLLAASLVVAAIVTPTAREPMSPPTPPPPVHCEHLASLDESVILDSNSFWDEAVVLVSGMRSSGECATNLAAIGSLILNVGPFVAPTTGCPSPQIFVFGPHQKFQWLDATNCWSNGVDQAHVSMGTNVGTNVDAIPIPVRLWKVGTQSDDIVLPDAKQELERANQLLSAAGVGIVLNLKEPEAGTGTGSTPSLVTAATASTAKCDDLSTHHDFDAKALNVYYTYNVALGEVEDARGYSCGVDSRMILRNTTADAETLSHELGHALGLSHFKGEELNVMTTGSEVRRYFTTGQAFRANVRSTSFLNGALHFRNGPIDDDCPDTNPAGVCPSESRSSCPMPAAPPLFTLAQPSSPVETPDQWRARAIARQWLTCEECSNQELYALRETPATIDIFLETVSGIRTQSEIAALSLKLREAFRTLQVYEADPRNWRAGGSEDEYVRRYLSNDLALQQIRSAHALLALRPSMSKAQLARAHDVLNLWYNRADREDVRLALRPAAAAF